MRIAVCDDEKVFLQMICNKIDSFYKSLDVCCIAFGDGSEIIKAYECGQRFDAVFLDIEMKKLDGMKTAERIRSFSSEVPIIFLTSHTEFAMEGYEVGAMRFLQKPVKNDKLEQALTDIKNFYGSRCNPSNQTQRSFPQKACTRDAECGSDSDFDGRYRFADAARRHSV